MKRNRLLAIVFTVMFLLGAALFVPNDARAETVLATGTSNTQKLNIRAGAGLNYSIVDSIGKEVTINIYEVLNGWLRIDVPSIGKSGFVNGKYVDVIAPYSPFYGFGYTSGTVHLRAKASSGSSKVDTLSSGVSLTLLSVADNGWYSVRVHDSGKEGYVSNRYVKITCKVAKSANANAATISGEGVNLRSGAGSSYKSLGKLSRNTAVTVLSVSGNWYEVKINATGKTGYVFQKYVKLSGSTVPTAAPSAGNATINRSGVNMRAGASTDYKSLGKLSRNTAVSVLSTSGSWYEILVVKTGKKGYVYKTYVTFLSATPTPAVTAGSSNAYINASGVNLRSGASTANKSLGRLTKNTGVTVLDLSGDWYHIQLTGSSKTGYVYKTYVTLLGVTATPLVTPKLMTATPAPAPTPTPTPGSVIIRTPVP